MRKKIKLEYIFASSVKVLYARLSTPSGLAEWFSDDVYQNENKFVFVWQKSENTAILVDYKPNSYVRFVWDDAEDEDEYLEFAIEEHPLTKDVALIITDFTDEDEESDSIELWNKQIEALHRTLGA